MTRRAKWWTALLVLVGLAVAARYAGSYALGAVLKSVFARGTGCLVSIQSAKLSFFPIEGEGSMLIVSQSVFTSFAHSKRNFG